MAVGVLENETLETCTAGVLGTSECQIDECWLVGANGLLRDESRLDGLSPI